MLRTARPLKKAWTVLSDRVLWQKKGEKKDQKLFSRKKSNKFLTEQRSWSWM